MLISFSEKSAYKKWNGSHLNFAFVWRGISSQISFNYLFILFVNYLKLNAISVTRDDIPPWCLADWYIPPGVAGNVWNVCPPGYHCPVVGAVTGTNDISSNLYTKGDTPLFAGTVAATAPL